MMKSDNGGLTFSVTAHQNERGQFSVPRSVERELTSRWGIRSQGFGRDGTPFVCRIVTPREETRLTAVLRSGSEIYGPHIAQVVRSGDALEVTIYDPGVEPPMGDGRS